MRVDLIVSALPPVHDAIGEYTARLATALADCADVAAVRVLTDATVAADPIEGARVEAVFEVATANFVKLVSALVDGPADLAVLQYNPFSWGRRGWAPNLVRAMRAVRRARPSLRFAVMFHETFMSNRGWRAWVMRQFQWPQYHALVDLADVPLFSTSIWADEQRQRGVRRAYHLPVGSNLPFCPPTEGVRKEDLEIQSDAFVCGALGSTHPSRPWEWVMAAIARIRQAGRNAVLLYIGRDADHMERMCHAEGIPVITTGRLDAQRAAAHFRAMDLFLAPFTDGVSTRRGSVMAALQHGVPVLTTKGRSTDGCFGESPSPVSMSPPDSDEFADLAAVLSNNGDLMRQLRIEGPQWFERHASWHVIATRLLEFVHQ